MIAEDRIIAPFLLFSGLGDDPKLSPDEFAQGDALSPGMGFGAGSQILGEKNGGAMHIHMHMPYGYGCQDAVGGERLLRNGR